MYSKELRAEVNSREQLCSALEQACFRFVYAPVKLLCENTPHKDRIIVMPPIFLGDSEEQTEKSLCELKSWGFEHALAHTVGHIELLQRLGFLIHGGLRLNIANSEAASFFAREGLGDILLSCELTAAKINVLASPVPKGIMAYGRLSLMATRRCPVNNGKPCEKGVSCGRYLTDRQGRKIRLLCDNTVELLNPDVLTVADKAKDFSGADFFLLRFTDEKNIVKVTENFIKGIIPEKEFTRGLYYRGVE